MTADRPDKESVRRDWIQDVVARRQAAREGEPLYLTLPGRAGHEITMLMEEGVLRTAETGAIHEDDLKLVVAIENDSEAVLALKDAFPGLRVLKRSVLELMGSDNALSFGSANDRPLCRAVLMNLDFNGGPKASMKDGQLVVRELLAVAKLAIHHAEAEHVDWTLFLTFNAMGDLPPEVLKAMLRFLRTNMTEEPVFAAHCRAVLTAKLLDAIEGENGAAPLTIEERQQLLMAFVPKKIAHLTHSHWRVVTRRNARYGGHDGSACMVTFAMDFEWDNRGSVEVYRESLRTVLESAAEILPDGTRVLLI